MRVFRARGTLLSEDIPSEMQYMHIIGFLRPDLVILVFCVNWNARGGYFRHNALAVATVTWRGKHR